ncbi:hypothetical protein I4U23_015246 [Adineta vaga]|nr:hypothetical protein I4U23_015246 [Adineta vaga]
MSKNITVDSNQSISNVGFSDDSTTIIIQLPILLLSIILAIGYTILILSRPIFRSNKLNWFTINVCLTSAWLCILIFGIQIQQLLNISSRLSCRLQGYLSDMAACQLMYSHCVVAISRLFTIVHANKHFFRSNIYIWICIGCGWLVAFLIALPYLFVDGFACSITTQATFLPYYTLITTLFIPITIVTVCNARIFVFVHQSTRRVHTTGTGYQVSHSRDVFLLKTMIGTFIVFFIGWTPSFVIQMFNKNDSIPRFLDACFQILPSLTILHDVIFLIYMNQPVRSFLKQIIIHRP